MFVVAFIAFAIFATCSFWIPRIARRIQAALETRHPDLLDKITPADSAHWTEHMRWQGSVAVAWAFLPIAYGLDDKPLESDVARFKIVAAVSVVTLLITAVSVYLALQQ